MPQRVPVASGEKKFKNAVYGCTYPGNLRVSEGGAGIPCTRYSPLGMLEVATDDTTEVHMLTPWWDRVFTAPSAARSR
jgi:hypothetical protein